MGKKLIIKGADFSANAIDIEYSKNLLNPTLILEGKILGSAGDIINAGADPENYCVFPYLPVSRDIIIDTNAFEASYADMYPSFVVYDENKNILRIVGTNPAQVSNFQQYIYQEGDAFISIRFRKNTVPYTTYGFAWATEGTEIPAEGVLPFGEKD